MTEVVLPRTITRGAIEDVTHVNENFEALRGPLNGHLELAQFADQGIKSEALSGGMQVGVWIAQSTFMLATGGNGLGDYLVASGSTVAVTATDAGERATQYYPYMAQTLPGRTAMLRGRVALLANQASSAGTVEIDLVRVTPVAGAAGESKLAVGTAVLSCGQMAVPGVGGAVEGASNPIALSSLVDGCYCCRIRRLTGFSGVGTNMAVGVYSVELAYP